MNKNNCSIREYSVTTWKDIRGEVLKKNKILANLIDAISPDDSYKFIKANYLFGDMFVKNGELYLPSNNTLLSLPHLSVEKDIQKELSYSPVPLFLILDKNVEFFLDTKKRIIPINLMHQGSLGGTSEALDYVLRKKSTPIWSCSAGARSIFMLPKISNKFGLKRLQMSYDIPTTSKTEKPTDHWDIFKNIAQNSDSSCPWCNSILFFGKKWLDNDNYSKEWSALKMYLLSSGWDQANLGMDKTNFNFYWESFARIISARRLYPKPFLIYQIKHLLTIVAGAFPGFVVADNAQESAPTTLIQKAITDAYELKEYLPTLMQACMPNDSIIKPKYVYYSLSLPTTFEGSPLKNNSSTIINDLREIKLLIETLKNHHEINSDFDKSEIIKKTDLDYFHHKKDGYNEIRLADEIPREDNSFLQSKSIFPSRIFCPTGQFFSGCIRINCA